MRKIPKKNYLFVIILSIFTIILTLYLTNLYDNKTNNNRITFISEIKENELKSYITETREAIIYMSSSNTKYEELENNLKKYTLENNLEDKFVYLDLGLVKDNFYNKFYVSYINESYTGDFKIIEPTIVFIKEGKVISYKNNISNIEEIKKFFEDNGVLE